MLRLVAALAVVVLVAGHAVAEEKTPPVEFEKHVRPLLEKHCLRCHGADENESGLRLDSPRHILTGGDRGKSIVAGKADESLLYLALVGKGDVSQMPAEGPPLSADEIAIIRRWIEKGAKLPESGEAAGAVAGSDHWSFQPIVRPDLPDVQLAGWVQDPLDRFVLARLQSEGLAPSPEADRPTLIRRLSLDLRGLPPSLEEVERFVNDGSPDAYERLVDEFLGSPHFGERWGRHWLDAARYADSNGFTIDGPRSIWKYRDWVIEAFNRDLPFDRFT
ncbi:MAG: DUF1549 domain-containing protein, partial [Planctomycetes bacterium]|nr:DUF1549 domain-containing protein [Planctomycetota bacterium]